MLGGVVAQIPAEVHVMDLLKIAGALAFAQGAAAYVAAHPDEPFARSVTTALALPPGQSLSAFQASITDALTAIEKLLEQMKVGLDREQEQLVARSRQRGGGLS